MSDRMSNWNDDRLDELNRRVENGFAQVDREMKEGFAKVDKRFDRVEGEMKEGFAQTASREELAELKVASREEMGEVKVQLNRINDRIDRLYYLLLAVMVSLIGALIANSALT